MDSASLNSLTPILDNVDRWIELAEILPVIVSLELILSADNAVALASITRALNNEKLQSRALNIGILIALIFRVLLILTAQIVLKFWPIQLLGGIYLLILSINKFKNTYLDGNTISDANKNSKVTSIIKVIFLIALTDLAFSIDSVTAAVAISDQFLLVITGAVIGVLALRFTSGLFIRWLEIFPRLELSGYLAVGLIGMKLIIELIFQDINIPEYLNFSLTLLIFIWGFSSKLNQTNTI